MYNVLYISNNKYPGLQCWILYGLKTEKKNFNLCHVLTIETALAVLQSTKVIPVNSVTSTTSSFWKTLAIMAKMAMIF